MEQENRSTAENKAFNLRIKSNALEQELQGLLMRIEEKDAKIETIEAALKEKETALAASQASQVTRLEALAKILTLTMAPQDTTVKNAEAAKVKAQEWAELQVMTCKAEASAEAKRLQQQVPIPNPYPNPDPDPSPCDRLKPNWRLPRQRPDARRMRHGRLSSCGP